MIKKKDLSNYGFDLDATEILNALKDLKNYTLDVGILLDRYKLDFPKTRWILYENQLHGVKVVFHHAYYLKNGKVNPENPTTDQYEAILNRMPSSFWEVVHTED